MVGGIAAAIAVAATAEIGNRDVTRGLVFAQGAILAVPIGIGIGAFVDRRINRTVFEQGHGATLRTDPLLRARVGMQASLRF